MSFVLMLLVLSSGVSNAQIHLCNESNVHGLRLCSHEHYDKSLGQTVPALVKEKVVMYDIPEFNQNEKTVTIFMMLKIYWNDTRVMLKSSDASQ